MRPRARMLIPVTLVTLATLVAAGVVARFRPLSLERVNQQLGPDPSLVFAFETDANEPEVPCGHAHPPDVEESGAETAVAIAAGWLSRTCEHDRVHLRLTPEGKRLSSGWSKSPPVQAAAGQPKAREERTTWFVSAARFERMGAPEIQSTASRTRRHVVVNGRWVLGEEGRILQRVGWEPLRGPAVREEDFELRLSGWHRIPNVIGHDLSGL